MFLAKTDKTDKRIDEITNGRTSSHKIVVHNYKSQNPPSPMSENKKKNLIIRRAPILISPVIPHNNYHNNDKKRQPKDNKMEQKETLRANTISLMHE